MEKPLKTTSGLQSDAEHRPPDTAAMFQRHCTSLDSLRCFLDLFSVLRSLPQITAVRQQMERQDDSEQANTGKNFDILNLLSLITFILNILFVFTWMISTTRLHSSRMRTARALTVSRQRGCT